MITKAIIEQIESDGYHVRVRIPILHKISDAPGATPFRELPIALVNYAPGIKPNYSVGDVVYVAFENNQYSEPVIIGALLNDDYTYNSGSIITDSISLTDNASGNDVKDILQYVEIDSPSTRADLSKDEYEELLQIIDVVLPS